MEKKTVIVTGIGGNVGQGILRNIRSSFPEVKIIGLDIASFTPGNYLCDKSYQVPYAFAPEYIPSIQDIVDSEKVNLIIPSTDYEVFFLSLNREVLGANVAASEPWIAKIYLDKYLSYQHHSTLGIPFAKSWLPGEYDFSETSIIAKPREGRGSRGIIINPANPALLGEDYMIQPYVEGTEITTAVYINRSNEIHGIFTMERELQNGTTSKSKVIFEYDEQLEGIISKMIKPMALHGSFNIQSIVTSAGEIVPFEINCRISGTNSIRHNLGFQDVKYTLQEYLFNETPDRPKPIRGIATRILLDVIYPGAQTEESCLNNTSNYFIF
jgi:carbamoyl-phosphate synthase large subunit